MEITAEGSEKGPVVGRALVLVRSERVRVLAVVHLVGFVLVLYCVGCAFCFVAHFVNVALGLLFHFMAHATVFFCFVGAIGLGGFMLFVFGLDCLGAGGCLALELVGLVLGP